MFCLRERGRHNNMLCRLISDKPNIKDKPNHWITVAPHLTFFAVWRQFKGSGRICVSHASLYTGGWVFLDYFISRSMILRHRCSDTVWFIAVRCLNRCINGGRSSFSLSPEVKPLSYTAWEGNMNILRGILHIFNNCWAYFCLDFPLNNNRACDDG